MADSDEKPAKRSGEKEGKSLIGEPTFEHLPNGRFKCIETGHELPHHAKDSYAHSKRCRIGLINHALSMNKTPLNIFNQYRLNKQMEAEEKEGSKAKEKGPEKKKKQKKEKKKEEIISEVRDSQADSDSEEPEFWMPPVGKRWDFDRGGDRWGSDSESSDQGVENEEENIDSADLSKRTKRMSIDIGPSSFASRKKKSKTKSP